MRHFILDRLSRLLTRPNIRVIVSRGFRRERNATQLAEMSRFESENLK
jgi:hypothetical protein